MQVLNPKTLLVVAACALAGLLFGVIASLRIPREYASSAMVVVQALPTEAASSDPKVGNGAEPNRKIAELVERAFTRDAMAAIVSQYDLYPQERAKMPMDEAIREMRMATRVAVASPAAVDKEITRINENARAASLPGAFDRQAMEDYRKRIRLAFTVQFQYPDPRKAQMADGALVGLIARENRLMAENHESAFAPWLSGLVSPTLPDKPVGPGVMGRGLIGLIYGLLGGVLLAVAMNVMKGRRTA